MKIVTLAPHPIPSHPIPVLPLRCSHALLGALMRCWELSCAGTSLPAAHITAAVADADAKRSKRERELVRARGGSIIAYSRIALSTLICALSASRRYAMRGGICEPASGYESGYESEIHILEEIDDLHNLSNLTLCNLPHDPIIVYDTK